MSITFESYLRHRAPALGLELTGIIRDRLASLPFGVIAGEFRRYVTINKLRYDPNAVEVVIRPYRTAYNTGMHSDHAQTTAKLGLIDALDTHSEALKNFNRLAVTPPGDAEYVRLVPRLRPGYSVAGGATGAGTIGGFIHSAMNNVVQYYVLSNAHVLAQNPRSAADASVTYQPAQADGGTRRVGQLAHYTRLFDAALNPLDAAIALIDPLITIQETYGSLGEIMGVRDPVIGETLRMFCRTSGYTEAFVDAVDRTSTIDVPLNHMHASMTFSGITRLTRGAPAWVNLGGDSGGVWIGSDMRAVVLNFAGGEDSIYGYGFPMPRVIEWVRAALGDPRAGLAGIEGSVWPHA